MRNVCSDKAFREKGYQIGSGVIESACKHVVAAKMQTSFYEMGETGHQCCAFLAVFVEE